MDQDATARGSSQLTLAIDVGGSKLKAGVLDGAGIMVRGPERMTTPDPATPEAVIGGLVSIVEKLRPFDRVSLGFPGVVRGGMVVTAPNLGTARWHGHRLAAELHARLGAPVRMLNDASVQGLGVIEGKGLECVITLGTGMGFALFMDGLLTPHLELSQHPVHKNKTYDEWIGNAALREAGPKRWNKRIAKAIAHIEALVNFDTLLIGGGNARMLDLELPHYVRIVSNEAGITGGIRLWDHRLDTAFPDTPIALGEARG